MHVHVLLLFYYPIPLLSCPVPPPLLFPCPPPHPTPPRPPAPSHTQVGADIVKRALCYPLKLIASNAGDNGSVVMQRVLESDSPHFGYNAATGQFEDLMASGIIDPAKVRGAVGWGGAWARACQHHARSLRKEQDQAYRLRSCHR